MVAILAFLLAAAPAFVSAATIDVQVGPTGQFVFSPENVVSINFIPPLDPQLERAFQGRKPW